MANSNLNKAKSDKNDEFYTQLSDIEDEMRHYQAHFKGKVIYCNCDDPLASNFFKFFFLNFERLGLKKLIATCYQSIDVGARTTLSSRSSVKIEYAGSNVPLSEVKADNTVITPLKGDGDFRSDECIKILKTADIVVTNPPFSLFREYIDQLTEHDKSFIIVGSMNAITYKEFFPFLRDDKVWLGNKTGGLEFEVPMSFEQKNTYIKNNKKYAKFGNITWFTNLDIAKRHQDIVLFKTYNPDDYPKYDDYDAIEVSKVSDIPLGYKGVMGVPITFLTKYNPSQFEVLGLDRYIEDNPNYGRRFKIGGKEKYARLLIRAR